MDVTITDEDVASATDAYHARVVDGVVWREDIRAALEAVVPGIVERRTADLSRLADESSRNMIAAQKERNRLLASLARYDGQAWDDLLAERDRLRAQVDAVTELAGRWEASEDGTARAAAAAIRRALELA